MPDENKCNACPECDCKVFVNANLLGEGYRRCRACGQEWWTGINYSKDQKKA